MNITIIGLGLYGMSMAHALSQNKNNRITIWSESEENIKKTAGKKIAGLNNITLDNNIKYTTSYEEALKDAELVFIMSAAKFVGSVSTSMKPFINKNMHFIIGSKGIEQNSCLFVHEVFKNNIKTKNVAVISGGSFAIDIANLEPVGLSIASKSNETIAIAKKAYKNTTVKLRESHDLVGTELCGSIKNVIAIASGILEGLGYKESTRSFLITESLHDIKELIKGLGGSKKTILSFAGVGDLLLTATSVKSRNYSYGILLGKGDFEASKKYLEETTVEGFYTLKSIYTLIKRRKIKMPIIDLIYKIVMDGEDSNKLADFLMKKD